MIEQRATEADTGRPARLDRRQASPPAVTVVVPTYNESDNIPILIEQLRRDLSDLDYEVVIVDDDSPDRTWDAARSLAKDDPRFQVLRRRNQRGLSSAVLTGMSVASGRVLVVMDADLQHDTATIPVLVTRVLEEDLDLCVASRQSSGGSYGEFSRSRRLASDVGAGMARIVLPVAMSDPMSGFFAVSRARYEAVHDDLNPLGFKILLEFVVRGPIPRLGEVGYHFGRRLHGTTKLSGAVVLDYLRAVIELAIGRRFPVDNVVYSMVALVSALAWIISYRILAPGGPIPTSGPMATVAALEIGLLVAYAGHNGLTFPGRRLRGPDNVRGLAMAHLVGLYGWLVHGSVAAVVDGRRLAVEPTAVSGPVHEPIATLITALAPVVSPGSVVGLLAGLVAVHQLHRSTVWGSTRGAVDTPTAGAR